MTLRPAATLKTTSLWILRHGQAMHNPRAEVAREAGCSKAEFLEWMRKDDALDAPLTALGIAQARAVAPTTPDVVIASPLSRALQTADLACPPARQRRRICYEGFREINGWLLNAKRRSKTELQSLFPTWDFANVSTEEDVLWEPTLEEEQACGERGYQGLQWIASEFTNKEESVLLVVHGGILAFTLQLHPHVTVRDARTSHQQQERSVTARFSNCELRRYQLQVEHNVVTLTEVDLDTME